MKIKFATVLLLIASINAHAQTAELALFSADGSQLSLPWWDVGSGSNIDGSFWGPPSGLQPFSHIARRGYARPAEMLWPLELQPALNPLENPVAFEQVWNDSGSGADLDGAIWRPVAPEGYACLGMVATRGYAVPALNSIACVRNDLVVLGTVGNLIWWDQGSGAGGNFSAWDINCPAGSIDINGFIGVNNYFQPPGPVYCLSESAIQLPPGPELPAVELQYTDQSTLAWWDVGSGADLDGSYWAPTVPAGEGIGIPTHLATRGYSAPIGTLVMREISADAFALPLAYELVWTDSGSGADLNGAVWRPIAPLGYRCLGMVVTNGAAPADDAVTCVHSNMTVPGQVGNLIWWDRGSGADADFSSWKIDCPAGAIDTNGFIGVLGHTAPNEPVSCLSEAAVTPTATPTLTELEQLINQFGPIIRFHPNEAFLPDDPAAIIDDPSTTIVWETVQNESDYDTFVETFLGSFGNPTSATILDDVQAALSHPQAGDPDFRYFLDFSANGALRAGNLERTQAYVRVQPSDGAFVELQFWIFYPWNGPGKAAISCGIVDLGDIVPTGQIGEHYSDWESIRVRVTRSQIGNLGNWVLTDVVMSRHSFEETAGPAALQLVNGRPVIYSARDSHAHYRTAGRQVYANNATDLGVCDLDVDLFDLTGDGLEFNAWEPGNYVIESSAWPEIDTQSNDWLFFGGRWGGYDRAQLSVDLGIFGTERVFAEVQNGKPGLIRRNEWNLGCPINANLGALRTSAGTLSPAFAPNVTAYTLNNLGGATELNVTPLAMNHDAVVEVRINGGNWATLPGGTLYGLASDALPLGNGANTVEVRLTVAGCGNASTVRTYTINIPSAQRFGDVSTNYWAYAFIEALAASGVTGGCGNGNYCPDNLVTRAQMAVFLERGSRGSNFVPPPATGTVFGDVAANAFAAAFIEQLFADGITGGCGGGNYCPNNNVTRAQMAVFLLRAVNGTGYSPPPATGVFPDAPPGSFAAAWIEALAAAGITGGCGGGNYCPNDAVTRAQMAVFLVRAFGL